LFCLLEVSKQTRKLLAYVYIMHHKLLLSQRIWVYTLVGVSIWLS